jgi:polyisoprenoid-binding protein YceI
MTRYRGAGTLATLLLVPAAIAATGAVSSPLVLQPESRVWVSGTSTVRAYECSATVVDAQVTTSSSAAASAVLAGEKAVTGVAVRIPARQLDCRNDQMNEHMLRALKADQHGDITFRLASYELTGSGASTRVRMQGSLDIGGASRSVAIQAAARDGGGGALRVTGAHEVRLSEFGLTPPTLMLGTLRVHDRVMVNFDLMLRG